MALALTSAYSVASDHHCSVLATSEQLHLEKLALSVLSSSIVQQQKVVSKAVYQNDPMAQTPSGIATLEAALDSIAVSMVQWAVNEDASRPKLMWVTTASHSWNDIVFPNSGYGIENPDNVYRHAPIDGSSRYEVRGKLPADPPATQSFTLYATLPGTGELSREGSMILGALDGVETKPDGSFVVTIDRDPAAGRANHIQSADQTALLIVRDSLTNWERQEPVPLTIHRVGGPKPPAPRTEAYMAQRAATLISQTVPFWANYNRHLVYSRPVNEVQSPKRRGGGWGYSLSGHFDLGRNQVLIVTLDPAGAEYLGFQLADPWGVGLEYVTKNGSLNSNQALSNHDGTVTYVISDVDPGIHNWLDTSGLSRGIFAVRWQGVPAAIKSGEGMVRDVKVVPRSKLMQSLPEGTPTLTHSERTQQLERRQSSFEHRVCGQTGQR